MNAEVLSASCHCGAVNLQVSALPATYTVCNCSICRRYAARWLYYQRKDVVITARPNVLECYVWGDCMINFCFCKTCGCMTHYEDVARTADSRVALNGNMLPPGALEGLRVRRFDGADTFRAIE